MWTTAVKSKYFAVTASVPGYLPDSPENNGYFDDLEKAVEYAWSRTADYPEFDFVTIGDGLWLGDNGDGAEIAIEIIEISKKDYEREVSNGSVGNN